MTQSQDIRALVEELRACLARLLMEFDFLVESGVLPDSRNDVIFDKARKAIAAADPETFKHWGWKRKATHRTAYRSLTATNGG